MKEPGVDNVIHLDMGPDGRLTRKRAVEDPPTVSAVTKAGSPIQGLYSASDVARLFGYTPSRIRNWVRLGVVVPSSQVGGRRYFTFRDLVAVRAAKGLLDAGVPMQQVRRSVEALRRVLPDGAEPLADLRIAADGHRVVVEDEQGSYDPLSGQGVLEFQVDTLRSEVVRLTRAADDRRSDAYENYLRGCKLDEDESTYDEAEEAYRAALDLDPTLTSALTNLGNLYYRRDDLTEAERHYRLALQQDTEQPEALYNLGFLYFERGEIEAATRHFKEAIHSDPSFADAHFNLAMAYEEGGRPDLAKSHWRTYLALEPTGSWATIAQEHLFRDST